MAAKLPGEGSCKRRNYSYVHFSETLEHSYTPQNKQHGEIRGSFNPRHELSLIKTKPMIRTGTSVYHILPSLSTNDSSSHQTDSTNADLKPLQPTVTL